jgi:hypothetical protein
MDTKSEMLEKQKVAELKRISKSLSDIANQLRLLNTLSRNTQIESRTVREDPALNSAT